MSVESCPDPEELQRLIEERLGPVREAEIEGHVETCRPCQDQLERLTARRAQDKDDRATHDASGSHGPVVNGSMMADLGGTTEFDRATAVRLSEARAEGRTKEGATREDPAGERPRS